ncbi:MAG: Maf family protein [Firmicutes bacterium]|nr:Maf family protein [Bacillota bacterium]
MILASSSPRRQEILNMLGVDFKIISPDIDEKKIIEGEDFTNEAARVYAVLSLSSKKAEAVYKEHSDSIVIACDTMVFVDGVALGKPRDEADARRMLTMLAGKTHEVLSGVTIIHGGDISHHWESSKVTFIEHNELFERLVDSYIKDGLYEGKAGAYGIQDRGALFIKSIEGDYYNIMGLPIEVLRILLKWL